MGAGLDDRALHAPDRWSVQGIGPGGLSRPRQDRAQHHPRRHRRLLAVPGGRSAVHPGGAGDQQLRRRHLCSRGAVDEADEAESATVGFLHGQSAYEPDPVDRLRGARPRAVSARSYSTGGRAKRTLVPDSPGAIQILPPWVSTIAREIARPRPALVEVVAGDHGRMGLTQCLGSHLRLTRSDSSPSRESANIFPPTFKTEVSGFKGNVSSAPENERQHSRSASAVICSSSSTPSPYAMPPSRSRAGRLSHISQNCDPTVTRGACGEWP